MADLTSDDLVVARRLATDVLSGEHDNLTVTNLAKSTARLADEIERLWRLRDEDDPAKVRTYGPYDVDEEEG